jgi:hypothetical protein
MLMIGPMRPGHACGIAERWNFAPRVLISINDPASEPVLFEADICSV